MPQEKSEAIVLHGVDFSESSRIVTFLTPRRGRMACLAKGVRRKNSPLAAALDTMNRVELIYYWKDNRQVQTLAEAAVLDGFPAIKQDLARSAFAMFLLEIASKTAHENEPSTEFYGALTHGLSDLERWPGEARAHASWQLFRLLTAAGFEPVLEHCVQCGGEVSLAPGFSLDGGVVCAACRSDRRLSAKTYTALRAFGEAEEGCPDIEAGEEVFTVLRAYAGRHLETDFKSVRVLDQLFG